MKHYLTQLTLVLIAVKLADSQWTNWNLYQGPEIPHTLRGEWFSRERGVNVFTRIEAQEFSGKGQLRDITSYNNDNFTMVLYNATNNCHYCVRLLVRTLNVLDKIEGSCVIPPVQSFSPSSFNTNKNFQQIMNRQNSIPTSMTSVCRSLDQNQESITMFSVNPSGKNCRSSLEGRWKFSYQNQHKFTGECDSAESKITACQKPGTQFFNINQQFLVEYRACNGMRETQDAVVEYKCLGDWYIGKNHFFAVKNTRETRIEESYRCFMSNRDDDQFMSASLTAECNVLRSPQEGPERWRLSSIKDDNLSPRCTLPQNISGNWINTANFDAEVTIDGTKIVEKWRPDSGRLRQETYVCAENRGNRYVMARLGVNGCQKDYVCFKFIRKNNVLRFRKGQAYVSDNFATVCSWSSFDNQENWLYDIMVARNPTPTRCPIAGKFKFVQKGDLLFENRTRGGVTSPKPNVYCKQRISDFSVCNDQRTISIEPSYCLSVDQLGKPVDIYSEPDYEMKCLGYWKENLKSYLITYDPSDAYSRYRCWIYQRVDQNKIAMSMSVGAFCHVTQNEYSFNSRHGAQVSLSLTEYERESDDCPMHFDDGSSLKPEAVRVITSSMQ